LLRRIKKPEVKKVIKVTEKAAEKLKDVIARQKNPQSMMLRVSMGGFG